MLQAPAIAQRARKSTPPGVFDRAGLSSTLEVGTGQHSSAAYARQGLFDGSTLAQSFWHDARPPRAVKLLAFAVLDG